MKKAIAIVAGIVVVLAIAFGVLVATGAFNMFTVGNTNVSGQGNTANTEQNVNAQQENIISSGNTVSSTTTNINENKPSNANTNTTKNTMMPTENQQPAETPQPQPTENTGTDTQTRPLSGYDANGDDTQIKNSVDEVVAKQVASDFTQAFFTFDPTTANNGYYASYSKYIDESALHNSKLISERSNGDWQRYAASYDGYYNRVNSLEVKDISYGRLAPVFVTVEVVMEKNNSDPEQLEWQFVNRYRNTYAVKMTPQLKVTDISLMDSQLVERNIYNRQPAHAPQ